MADDGDFYVGYKPDAPASLARFVRGRLLIVLVACVALAAVFSASQRPFAQSNFEFGTVRSFEGWIEAKPYPTLIVERPGTGAGTSRYLLVVFGKHGAGDAVSGLDGQRVRLDGTLVYRDHRTMIEIADGTIEQVAGAGPPPSSVIEDLGRQTIRGEIVDSKCFLGVMKPGNLKPHRACATRCISGGIPPVLLARDASGIATYYLLVSSEGRTVNSEVLDMVAEPLEVTGTLRRAGDQLVLYADPGTYRRLE